MNSTRISRQIRSLRDAAKKALGAFTGDRHQQTDRQRRPADAGRANGAVKSTVRR